jgi:hypothetical protein
MGSKSSSAPPAPNPAYVSQQQTQSNVNTAVANAYLNRINQYGPDGSKTYAVTGGQDVGGNNVPTWSETTTLSPGQQRIYDSQQQLTQGTSDLANQYVGRIGDATSKAYSYDGLAAAPQYNEDYRRQQLQAITDRAAPQMQRDQDALRQRLANQGVTVGTEAWRAAQDDYSRAQNDFRLGADVQAGNAAAQQYGLEANTRDRAIQEMTNLRTQPINEVAALLGTGNGVQQPQFSQVPQTQVSPTDVSGNYWNAYQGQLAQQQMQQQSANATTGGLFGLGGTLLGGAMKYGLGAVSDIRMKDNIRRIGQTDDGQPLYFFTYKHDPDTPHVGLMAQDVEKIRPDAVFEIDGVKHVDYGKALPSAAGRKDAA